MSVSAGKETRRKDVVVSNRTTSFNGNRQVDLGLTRSSGFGAGKREITLGVSPAFSHDFSRIPVYSRAGGIVQRQPVSRGTDKMGETFTAEPDATRVAVREPHDLKVIPKAQLGKPITVSDIKKNYLLSESFVGGSNLFLLLTSNDANSAAQLDNCVMSVTENLTTKTHSKVILNGRDYLETKTVQTNTTVDLDITTNEDKMNKALLKPIVKGITIHKTTTLSYGRIFSEDSDVVTSFFDQNSSFSLTPTESTATQTAEAVPTLGSELQAVTKAALEENVSLAVHGGDALKNIITGKTGKEMVKPLPPR